MPHLERYPSYVHLSYCPRNEIKQMENELWNLKVKGTNLTAYNQRFQELILLCPEMYPLRPAFGTLHPMVTLSIKGNEKTRATNGNGTETTTPTTPTTPTTLATSTRTNAQRQQGCLQPGKVLMLASYLTAENVDDTTLTHALLLVTTVERQDIRPKTAELHLVPQTKEDQEAKEDREAMSLVSDVAKKDITRTRSEQWEQAVEIKIRATCKTLKQSKAESRNTKGNNQHPSYSRRTVMHLARVYSLCAEAAVKDNNVVNGTFLINNVFASILFDTGADRTLCHMLSVNI
ncbi:hypothetical protein Tco_0955502 [Tanacetum coccineum]|uniref:Reverse transcriptase domain-containing protein n=1 Tax=Tanacetum coccineum TaxID=301880 RepID=A0ABQ5E7G5_9ASTR